MTTFPSSARRQAGVAVVLGGLAFAVRLVAIWLTRHSPLRNDPADYQRIAVSIAGGHGFGRSVIAPGGGPSAFRPPLYPIALGLFYRVIGVHVTAARVAEAAIGAASVVVLGAIARRLWDERVACVAMVLMAFYPPLILSTTALLSESLAVPLELGAVLLALLARHEPGRIRWLALLGVVCGLNVLNRPNTALLLIPLVWLALPRWRERTRQASAGASLILGLTCLVLAPWMLRDYSTFGQFVPLTTQEGPVLSGTYNSQAAADQRFPAAFRPATLVPEDDAILRAHPHMGEVEMDQRLTAAALSYARSHVLYPAKVVFWNSLRILDLTGPTSAGLAAQAIGYSHRASDVALVTWYAAVALAVIGAARRPRAPAALWLVPVAVILSTVPFQGETRMRAGAEPFVLLLAAFAVADRHLRMGRGQDFRASAIS